MIKSKFSPYATRHVKKKYFSSLLIYDFRQDGAGRADGGGGHQGHGGGGDDRRDRPDRIQREEGKIFLPEFDPDIFGLQDRHRSI